MKHEYEDNIKCPYCDYEDFDNFDFNEDEGKTTCAECGKEFNVERNIEVSYSTSRIECEEDKHNYKLVDCYAKTQRYENDHWFNLSEDEYEWMRIEECTKCDDKIYIKITKDEYLEILGKIKK